MASTRVKSGLELYLKEIDAAGLLTAEQERQYRRKTCQFVDRC